MPADPVFVAEYATSFKFESGESNSKFIGTSKPSGEYRFWVIRVWAASEKCLRLEPVKKDRVIFDTIGKGALMNLLAHDNKNFFTKRPDCKCCSFIQKNYKALATAGR